MAKDHTDETLNRELEELPSELRWREWMRRIEAVLFASASPVPRDDLARVVGQGVSVDLLIDDLVADLEGRSFEVAKVAGGWVFRTRPVHAAAIRVAADVGGQDLDLRESGQLYFCPYPSRSAVMRDIVTSLSAHQLFSMARQEDLRVTLCAMCKYVTGVDGYLVSHAHVLHDPTDDAHWLRSL